MVRTCNYLVFPVDWPLDWGYIGMTIRDWMDAFLAKRQKHPVGEKVVKREW